MRAKPESCRACPLWGDGRGFMAAPDGTFANGVLLIGEALGEQEALEGKPFVGRAGLQLVQMLQRKGLKRESFGIDNTLRCRPPDNKLSGAPYEEAAIQACAPFLDGTIRERRPRVLVPLGAIAARRVLGREAGGITENRGYVSWSARYGAFVLPTFYPAYIMRGQHRLTNVFLHDLEHATEIARMGWHAHRATLICDPTPQEFARWAGEAEAAFARDPRTILAFDIETPYKQGEIDEGELDLGDPTTTILRIGFAYREGEAVTVPFQPQYWGTIRQLLQGAMPKVVWNGAFDCPRLAANGFEVAPPLWDGMWAWHVLNSDLEKGLAFVSTFYCKDQPRWKHRAKEEPAEYNAIDAEVTVRIAEGVRRDLERMRLWGVFDRHVTQLDQCLREMSAAGVPVDDGARRALEGDLKVGLAESSRRMAAAVPPRARRLKVFKRPVPAEKKREGEWTVVEGTALVTVCSACEAVGVTKGGHTTRKRGNPCHGAELRREERPTRLDARVEPFVPSKTQMMAYLRERGHRPIFTRSKAVGRTETFNEDALKKLMARYREDRLYPEVLTYREHETLLSRYTGEWDEAAGRWQGGLVVGPDGRVHTIFGHTPSTLRLSSENPNMQNIPRGGAGADLAARVKELFIAEPGCVLFEADYSAIEAVLVGYFAGSRDYIRLAKLGVHDFFNSHVLRDAGKIREAADVRWSDADLRLCFADLKKRFKEEREGSKRVVHLSSYGGTPRKMYEKHPELFRSERHAQELQELFFAVCPDVRRWQGRTIEQAEKQAYLRNPFGYVHRFWRVKEWTRLADGTWEASWGEDAKRALAFLPQSTASGIIAEAILRLFQRDGLGAFLRLQIHDAILSMLPIERAAVIGQQISETMAEPVEALPLDPALGLGTHLAIGVEAKIGERWGRGMRGFELERAA